MTRRPAPGRDGAGWHAAACALLERDRLPAAWLDRGGRLCLANDAFLHLAGATRAALGLPVAHLLDPAEAGPVAALHQEALSGAASRHEAELTLADGRRLRLALENRAWGAGAGAGVLVRVMHWTLLAAGPMPLIPADFDYVVDGSLRRFGTLRAVSWPGGALSGEALRHRACHELLHGRAEPCTGCPALGGGAWPRTSSSPLAGGAVQVTTADLDGDDVLLRVRTVGEAALAALVASRVDTLAARLDLSPRESEVLRWLLLGRGAAEVASILGIAPRTAKHHQQAVLRKAGAPSRAALLRLVV